MSILRNGNFQDGLMISFVVTFELGLDRVRAMNTFACQPTAVDGFRWISFMCGGFVGYFP